MCAIQACQYRDQTPLEILQAVVGASSPSPYVRVTFAEELETQGDLDRAASEFDRVLREWKPEDDVLPTGPGRTTFPSQSDRLWLNPAARVLAFRVRSAGDSPDSILATMRELRERIGKSRDHYGYYVRALLEQLYVQDAGKFSETPDSSDTS